MDYCPYHNSAYDVTIASWCLQIRDAYMLKIFENNMTRLPNWCNNRDEKVPFCQILGEYRMELPDYNTLEPYAKMNENCPSLPPNYERPVSCWVLFCALYVYILHGDAFMLQYQILLYYPFGLRDMPWIIFISFYIMTLHVFFNSMALCWWP